MKRILEVILVVFIVGPAVFMGLAAFGIVPEWTPWIFTIPWYVFGVGFFGFVFVALFVFAIKDLRKKSTRDSVWYKVRVIWQSFVDTLRGASFKGWIFIILGVFLATCFILINLQTGMTDNFSLWTYLLVPSVITTVLLVIMFSKRRFSEENAQESLYRNLGIAYHNKAMYDEAITEYKKAIEIKPTDYSTHYNLGVVYGLKGMYGEAIAEYKKAIEIKPNDYSTHYNLGLVYGLKAMYDEAVVEFNRAVAIKPGSAKAHHSLGTIYHRKREYSLAIEHYDKAIELGFSVDPELLEFLESYREK